MCTWCGDRGHIEEDAHSCRADEHAGYRPLLAEHIGAERQDEEEERKLEKYEKRSQDGLNMETVQPIEFHLSPRTTFLQRPSPVRCLVRVQPVLSYHSS